MLSFFVFVLFYNISYGNPNSSKSSLYVNMWYREKNVSFDKSVILADDKWRLNIRTSSILPVPRYLAPDVKLLPNHRIPFIVDGPNALLNSK